jgi:hypothetical protein
MANYKDRNDPFYANNPNYVWSGGQWQYTSTPGGSSSKNKEDPSFKNNPNWYWDEKTNEYQPKVTGVRATSLGTEGFNLDPTLGAAGRAGSGPSMPHDVFYSKLLEQGANAPERASPYQAEVANQNRAAQLALLQQMQSRIANDSIAGTQGAQALAQNARQGLGVMGQGALGSRLASNQMAGVGGGLAGDIGRARAQEVTGGLSGGFGAASQIRGGDLSVMGDQAQAALKQRQLDDAAKMFFASQGSRLGEAQSNAASEYAKLLRRLELQIGKENQEGQKALLDGFGTILKLGAGI